MPHDLGYYVWQLLKVEEETTLFPEFFSIFKAYSRYEIIRSMAIHTALDEALQRVAADYGADVSTLESLFSDIIDILASHEEDDRFKLFWDFIYYFGGTKLEVPAKGKFIELVEKANIYMKVVDSGGDEEVIKQVAYNYGISTARVKKIVAYVDSVAKRFEAVGT